ncbi:hypothetical protein [Nonomuraea gerenzanensis]|uniref:Uncharacterized protein n=1 Tax=Nonomuraea gerenzanensis TaxID=93944 RepID=A0A1M4BL93_9ACTN|nr:hypothetical protein [Nonomuraea gerenzanensis]UBU09998.1 hypothetical protein LCN96_37355 [Nonomuraea gerenzanensis]SAP16293.1 hypothetical protein; putative NUDIX domain [Nonomuraea gerenzanensis]
MSYFTANLTPVEEAIRDERRRQDAKWGEQNHPDGTGRPGDLAAAEQARAACQANGPTEDNWRDILEEEVREAFAETGFTTLRAELVQVAAVVVNWVESMDRRRAAAIQAHQYDELIFGGFVCVTCTPNWETGDDPDDNVAWPCQALRDVGVTNEDAIAIIKARRAEIERRAAREAGAR